MNGIRVGFDARYINDRYHGIGRYAFNLIKTLIESYPQNTYIIFCGQAPDSRFNWSDIADRPNVVISQGPKKLYLPQEQVAWKKIIQRAQIDIFHTPYFVAPLWTTIPVVITIHDLIFERYPQYMPMAWGRPYYRLLMKLSLNKARRAIVVSSSTQADLARFYPGNAHKTRVIAEGIESHFQPVTDADQLKNIAEKYGLKLPFLLTVGAGRPHKNHVRLVMAYREISSKIPHTLVIAGPPDKRFPDIARQVVNESGLADRVRFLDWVNEADLPGLYSLADLVVLPSLIEGFGLPALEAMACGTAITAAEIDSFREIIGEAGNYFNPLKPEEITEKIDSLLQNRNCLERLSNLGRTRASQFTWIKAGASVQQIYGEIVEKSI